MQMEAASPTRSPIAVETVGRRELATQSGSREERQKTEEGPLVQIT